MTEPTTAATEDRQAPAFLTPETAGPLLESYLFPAPADPKDGDEQPAEAQAEAEPEAEAEAETPAEAAEGESDLPAEEAAPSEPQPRRFRVKVDADEVEVTEDELLRGYQRQADYTRKTMSLSDERKAFAAEQESVRAERQRIAARLKEVEDALAPPAVDWDKVQREHPDQFPTLWANYQRLEAERAKVSQERAEADAKARADWEAATKDRLAKERELLLAAVPEWRDEAKAKADVQALVTYAKSRGFTDQELQVTDHRLMLLLRDAALGASVRTAKPKVTKDVESRIKTVKPGSAGTVKPKVDADVALVDRFQKSGKLRDAAAVFEKLF